MDVDGASGLFNAGGGGGSSSGGGFGGGLGGGRFSGGGGWDGGGGWGGGAGASAAWLRKTSSFVAVRLTGYLRSPLSTAFMYLAPAVLARAYTRSRLS